MVFRRAIHESDKAARRTAILDAARKLMGQREGAPATVAQVARTAGVAKGTVYLYFRTSEEIYLALLADQYEDWFNAVERTLEEVADPAASLEAVLATLVEYPIRQPLFLRLANLHHSMIDSVPAAALRAWKLRLFERLEQLGERLENRFEFQKGDGARLLRNTHSLILGLHQMASPPAKVQEMLNEAEFREQVLDFEHELNIALRALWHGWRHRPAPAQNIRREK